MKDDKTVIREFNDAVNMTALELEQWLKTADSKNVGWSKGAGGGESVGHDSGRKIIEILKSNPKKDPNKYKAEQMQHMRKVVSYCKRHLAQEQQSNDGKTVEELKRTKSYASLKNWGHDPIKDRQVSSKNNEGRDDVNEVNHGGHPQRRSKRIKAMQNEDHDKRQQKKFKGSKIDETASGESSNEEEYEDNVQDHREDRSFKSKSGHPKNKSEKGLEPGDKVTWNWGQGQPEGKVLDVKPKTTSITTKRGSKVSRKGDAEDPAVVLDTGKSKAIKLTHEINK